MNRKIMYTKIFVTKQCLFVILIKHRIKRGDRRDETE